MKEVCNLILINCVKFDPNTTLETEEMASYFRIFFSYFKISVFLEQKHPLGGSTDVKLRQRVSLPT